MPALNVEVPLPGTEFKLLDDESIQINHPIEDVENLYAKENIKQYAQQYSYIFKDREDQKSGYEPIQVQKNQVMCTINRSSLHRSGFMSHHVQKRHHPGR